METQSAIKESSDWGCWDLEDSGINPDLEIGALEIIMPISPYGKDGNRGLEYGKVGELFRGDKPALNTMDRKIYDVMHESYRNAGNNQWWNSPLSEIDKRSMLHVGLRLDTKIPLSRLGYSGTSKIVTPDPNFTENRTTRLFEVGGYNFYILQQVIDLGEEVKLTKYEKNCDLFDFTVYRPVPSTFEKPSSGERYERFS